MSTQFAASNELPHDDHSKVAAMADAEPVAARRGRAGGPIRIDPEAYYPEADAATLLGKSTDTMRRQRWRGSGIPFCRYGRSIFYRGADMIAALDGSLRRSTSDEPGAALGT